MTFKEILFLFTFSFFLSNAQCQNISNAKDLQCFVHGECTNGTLLTPQSSSNEYECLDTCKSKTNCTWFTFYPASKACFLFETSGSLVEALCPLCLSGQKECTVPEGGVKMWLGLTGKLGHAWVGAWLFLLRIYQTHPAFCNPSLNFYKNVQ